MKTCRYCLKPITNDDNHGWVGEDGLRRCFYNNEVMLKEHIPMPDLTWVYSSAKEIYTKQRIPKDAIVFDTYEEALAYVITALKER